MEPKSLGASRRGFAAATGVRDDGPGRFSAGVDAGWTILGKPNGGYLLAMLGRAAVRVGRHSDVLAASAHYLSPPDPGPVVIEAEPLRTGRSASQIRARMSQDGRPCVEAVVTTGGIDPESAPYWDAGLPEMGTATYEECVRLVPRTPDGKRVAIMEQNDVRIEPASYGFGRGAPSGRGEIRGWLSLPGDEPFDTISLLFAVDAFPPATFDIEFSGWVPTLELTAYVRAHPAPGPVRVLHRAQLVQGHRVDEACFIWDRDGRLVAQATQLAGIRLG